MANRREVTNLIINTLLQKKYLNLKDEGLLNEDELYFVVDDNEKTEYGDLFGEITNQKDLDNALYASRIFNDKQESNDPRGYAILELLYDNGVDETFNDNLLGITFPYKHALEGSKIVDIAYVEQVNNLYSQAQEGNFFIIDKVNKTFRMPLPNIYSLIEKNSTVTLRKWED